MADENDWRVQLVEDVLLHEVRVFDRAPALRRNRRGTETRKVEQMHVVRVLEQRGDAAQALAATAPSVQEQDVRRRRVSAVLVDEYAPVVFEPLYVDCVARQGERCSLTCGFTTPAARNDDEQRHIHRWRKPASLRRPS